MQTLATLSQRRGQFLINSIVAGSANDSILAAQRDHVLQFLEMSFNLPQVAGLVVDCTLNFHHFMERTGQLRLWQPYLKRALTMAESNGNQAIGQLRRRLGHTQLHLGQIDSVAATLQAALAELDEDVERAMAWQDLGQYHLLRSDPDNALHAFEEARQLAQVANDQAQLINIWLDIAEVYRAQRNWAETWRCYRNVAESITLEGTALQSGRLNHGEGNIHLHQGSLTFAAASYNKALVFYRQTNDKRRQAIVQMNLGITFAQLNEMRSALDHMELAERLFAEAGDIRGQMLLLNNLSNLLRRLGNLAAARHCGERSIALCELVGNEKGIADSLVNIGIIQRWQGELEQAQRSYAKAEHIYQKFADDRNVAVVREYMALILRDQGQHYGALRHHIQAFRLFCQVNEDNRAAESLNYIGALCRDRGKYSWSLNCHKQANEMYQRMQNQLGMAESQGDIGLTYAFWRNWAAAIQSLSAAEATLVTTDNKYPLAIVRWGLARAYAGQGELDRGKALALQANQAFLELNAQEAEQTERFLQAITNDTQFDINEFLVPLHLAK